MATVIQFWNTEINPAAWIALAMGICVFLNVVAVKWYGESEFVMASLKVLLLFGLVMVRALLLFCGPPSFMFWNLLGSRCLTRTRLRSSQCVVETLRRMHTASGIGAAGIS